ncbi:MAG: Eukaryotic translation initiation factor 2 alpha subunit [Candidatus Methanosuratincola subterraneus]|uniref:Translation initiation factor 2 subunit alpha n=1 Tax=Methanosuratincola subterraneus TaxID=2593994 RepID=A0A444L6P7_METS7|nr:MAG: Eukaryotic translation initiation factor 2 alpha subunit [Candidatus Methanosuratincola subterraneus]
MMVLRKKEYPEIGEFVIATAVRLQEHGVYVSLDEYGKNGYVPIGEVASTWVKNIKDFVKEGQKLVLKVIRIDERKGHIDLSLRKVTEREKKEKLIQWKKSKKAEKILEMAAKKLGKEPQDAIKLVGIPLEEKYGDLYAGLEQLVQRGTKAVLEAGISEDWARALYDASKDHIEAPMVQITGEVKLATNRPEGVEEIKRALSEGMKAVDPKVANVEVYTLGAPRYRIEISAKDYRVAEEQMKSAFEAIANTFRKLGGTAEFVR